MCGSEQCGHCALLYASFRMNAFILQAIEMVQRFGQCSCPEHVSRLFLSCSTNIDWMDTISAVTCKQQSQNGLLYTGIRERERGKKKSQTVPQK